MKYKPIPISAAREIAKKYGKQQVIIVTWDAVHGKEHVTTYGDTKETCRLAAMGGARVKQALGWTTEESQPIIKGNLPERIEAALKNAPKRLDALSKALGIDPRTICFRNLEDDIWDLVQAGEIRIDNSSVMHWEIP